MAKIIVDYQRARAGLNDLEKSQWPFVLAKSLTDVAKAAQKNVRRRTKRQFKLHTKFVLSNIKIIPAKKADIVHRGIAQSVLYATKLIHRFMAGHEPGQRRKGLESRYIAIPGRDLPRTAKTAGGRIKKSMTPGGLLKGSKGRKRAKKGKGKLPSKAFIIPGKGGDPVIVRRGAKREPLQILYILKRKVMIKPEWNFVRTARAIADKRFMSIFNKNMKRALATIRK